MTGSITERIYIGLRDMILSGEYPPESILS